MQSIHKSLKDVTILVSPKIKKGWYQNEQKVRFRVSY